MVIACKKLLPLLTLQLLRPPGKTRRLSTAAETSKAVTELRADLSKDGRRLTPSKWPWLSCVRLRSASSFPQQSTLSGCEWKCSSSASCGGRAKWAVCSAQGRRHERRHLPELLTHLNTLDEVPHGEVVVEENTHEHLHHFLVELEGEV